MEQVVANIYAACLSAEAEPNGELVDLTISAIHDGMAGPNKDEALGLIFMAVEELSAERKQKGALFRIKLTAIASATKVLPQTTREVLLRSLSVMMEVAHEQSLSSTIETIAHLQQSIEKFETAVSSIVTDATHITASDSFAQKVERKLGLVEFLQGRGVVFAGSEKIFYAPNIPMKKISGAMQSIARWANPNEIAVLVDDTVFGGAKEGVFFTDEWMVFKEIMTDPTPYRLKDVVTIGVEGRKVYVNSIETVTLNIPEKRELSMLFSAVNDYIQTLKIEGDTHPSSKPASSRSERPQSGQSRGDSGGSSSYQTFFDKHIAMLASEHLFGEEFAYRQLLVELLRDAGSLPRFFQRNAIELTRSQLMMARGDGILLECYFYLFTVMQTLLINTCDFSWEQAQDFLIGMIGPVLIPYIDHVEAGRRGHGLRDAAVPIAFYEDSILMAEFRSRTQRYRDFMDSNIRELPEIFQENLCNPAVVELLPDAQAEQFGVTVCELIMDILGDEGLFEFMRDISAGIEKAMTRFFNAVNS